MRLSGLVDLLDRVQPFCRLAADLERLPSGGVVTGSVVDAAKPFVVAGLVRQLAMPTVCVVSHAARARQVAEQLRAWVENPARVELFAEPDALFYERLPADRATTQARMRALAALASVDPSGGSAAQPIVVASARAVMHPVMAPADFADALLELRVGDDHDPADLAARLLRAGFQASPLVEEPGTYSLRGGILDVFPPTEERPLRVEFWDETIESLRRFDPETQRSDETIERARIVPAMEVRTDLAGTAATAIGQLDLADLDEETRQEVERDVALLAAGQSFPGLTFYAPFLAQASLLDYVGAAGLLVVDERDQIEAAIGDLAAQAEDLRARLRERGRLPAAFPVPYFDWAALARRLPTVGGRLELTWPGPDEVAGDLADAIGVVPPYGGRLKTVIDECERHRREGRRVVVVSQQSQRLAELFGERGLASRSGDALAEPPPPATLTISHGTLAEGFQLAARDAGLFVLTDLEIFGWSKPRRALRRRSTARESFLSELSPGDHVVHVEHGVGKYRGLVRMADDGVEREYLWIDYADTDRLYVPVDQSDRVTRYVGGGDIAPVMHRLGSSDWARAKERVKGAVRELADELLKLYASRATRTGHAFGPDTSWQEELEDAFPYIETPDQLAAIRDVKVDMERDKPMDRLLCGDVGYGKTEVALRAAFKAVLDGKQVAVLVPTTVLAQQHLETFVERMQAFPVKVEMLSRFRSPREQEAIIAGIAAGGVDVCIGTHRLIQKDVVFKDLGLVVVDEEQRFGVAHKERLKQLRQQVDVLTLSATPIPRTLHMALAGVRDLSMMETAPEERLPIRTYVEEWDDELVREVIVREIDRAGQVFFVHNRVQSIYQVQTRLQKLVPEASFVVGHGQMPESQLEKVVLDFSRGKHDVLVCTTIIESGLDIPNANTIVIDSADKLGLAQLYQLRGRVGRGANRAYAYLLYRRNKQLSELADRRLKAIFEATELGAGFRIAMKDLEFRGAGNLLGAEQSGHVAAVGFHLYTQLLAEAVRGLQGEPEQKLPEVQLDLPIRAYLPPDYVADEAARLNIYQRLAAATSLEPVGQIMLELRDRFGPPPEPALDLIYLVQTRVMAALAGVAAIATSHAELVLRFHAEDRRRNARLESQFGDMVKAGRTHLFIDKMRLGATWQPVLQQILEALQ